MSFCCLGVAGLVCCQPASPTGLPLAPLPWHLADVAVQLPQDCSFESVSVDLLLLDDVPDRPQLFFAAVDGVLNGQQFYAGHLTLTPGGRQPTMMAGASVPELARGSMFTRWGDKFTESVRPGPTGWHLLSDHEGTIASVKHTHPWKKGWYTFRLSRMDAEDVKGREYRWVGAFVTDHATGFTQYLGGLRFAGREPKLDRQLGSFVEVLGPVHEPPPRPTTLPHVRAVFGNWTVNNSPVTPERVKVTYPATVPQHAVAAPADAFWATCEEKPPKGAPVDRGAFVVIVGPNPTNRRRFEEVLFTAHGK